MLDVRPCAGRRLLSIALVGVVVTLLGCSSSDGDSASSDSESEENAAILWDSVDAFVEDWNLANQSAPDVARLSLSVEDLETGPLSVGGDGFVAKDLIEGGSLLGTVDTGGEVSAVVTVVDPDSTSAESAIVTSVGAVATAQTSDGAARFVDAVPSAYGGLVDEDPGEQAFVAGPVGTPYSFVLTVIEHDDRRLVELAVIPIIEEALALDIVEILRDDLDDVAGS